MFKQALKIILCIIFLQAGTLHAAPSMSDLVSQQTALHPGLSGAFSLDKGEDALLTRAWMANNAVSSIDVQYFIWSTDNIGILAADALLRAAERGVKVRVIVDDLLIDAENKTLVALARHPNVFIRVYNPKYTVGTSFIKRIFNIFTNFRGVNQRMHNKTFMVDNQLAITGGRNMADEYFDYDYEYNFRDRDMLLAGPVVQNMKNSFEKFWNSKLSVDVDELLSRTDFRLSEEDTNKHYQELHAYADDPENFEAQVRQRIENLPARFQKTIDEMRWANVHFVSDEPGKNENRFRLDGGGHTTTTLANLVREAKKQVTIQSPYLILSEDGFELFQELIDRGVKIRINTNSLPASDNLPSFSGYARQRQEILDMGIDIYEFKPHPAIGKAIMQRYTRLKDYNPIFAVHAKTLVVDSKAVFVGTYNLDPRSENLNTEAGVYLYDEVLAKQIETSIEGDMSKGNSWNARLENGDGEASIVHRSKNFLLQFLPLDPIL